MKWQNVRDALQAKEAAIEFAHFRLFDKNMWSDTVLYCAIILRKDLREPVWVPLFQQSQLDALLSADAKDMEGKVQKLYSGGNPKFYNGAKLYQLVWEPLEKYLQDVETVYYSPSGALNKVSFSAIPVETVLLSDKYKMNLVSSTRERARLNKERAGIIPKGSAVVYGGLFYDADKDKLIAEAQNAILTVPEVDVTSPMLAAILPKERSGGAWVYLPGTRMEAEQICGYLNEKKIPNRIYTTTAGNEESFKRLSGAETGIIHLATHGFFLHDIEKDIGNREIVQHLGGNSNKAFENPMLRSGLMLAGGNRTWTDNDIIEGIEDGILTADEIAQMNLIKTKLVVLSACETGLGEANSSEGVFGLQRAFKLAGVETLIMSLWTVPDDATSELMSAFYQLWLSGKTKREAFAEAQRQVRAKYVKPYFWAGFVIMD
jgi:CHAT domain-containing protein